MSTPSEWAGLTRRWLVHSIDVMARIGNDAYGEPVDGPRAAQVPCFIDGTRARVQTEGSLDRRADFEVVFPTEIGVELNDTLQNGRDRTGRVLLDEGKVVRIDPNNHPELGELVRTAYVVRH